jgi:hypothetical protein
LEVSKKKLTLMLHLDSQAVALIADRDGIIHFVDTSGVRYKKYQNFINFTRKRQL